MHGELSEAAIFAFVLPSVDVDHHSLIRGSFFNCLSQIMHDYLGYLLSRPPWPAGPLWRTS